MRIFVTGNKGYIGSAIVPLLKESGHEVVGFDIGYFDDCNLTPIIEPELQHIFDIRDIEKKHLVTFDY